MDFGIEKCPMVVIEKGKIVKSTGIEFPGGKDIKSLQKEVSWNFRCRKIFKERK